MYLLCTITAKYQFKLWNFISFPLKTKKKKEDLTTVFSDVTRRRILSKEASIYTAEITPIKVGLKEIYHRDEKKRMIYTSHCNLFSLTEKITQY